MRLHSVMITRVAADKDEEYQLLWTEINGTTSMIGGFSSLENVIEYMHGHSAFPITKRLAFTGDRINTLVITNSNEHGWSLFWTVLGHKNPGMLSNLPSFEEAFTTLLPWLR